MWILQLNDMRFGNVENMQFIACGDTKESLERFVERETVPEYKTDEKWHKTFRQGGPLEWFNETAACFDHIIDIGTRESTMQRAAEHFDSVIDSLLRVD